MDPSEYFGAQRHAEGEEEDDARDMEMAGNRLSQDTGRQSNGEGQTGVHVVDIWFILIE